MADTDTTVPDPMGNKPPRPRRRIPLSLRIFLAMMVFLQGGTLWQSVRGYRQYVALKEVACAGGKFETRPCGPEWLRTHWGADLMKAFDEVGTVSLGPRATDAMLRLVSRFEKLGSLDADGAEISDSGILHLKALSRLKQISLDGTRVTDAGLAHLRGMTYLESLSLRRTRVAGHGLSHLRQFTSLKELFLDDTRIDDAGLRELGGLTQLRSLSLSGTQVTGTGLQHLAGLPKLTWLSIARAPVNDAGIEALDSLTGLVALHLEDVAVSDRGLAQLGKLKNLRFLFLEHALVTNTGVMELARKCPTLVIFFSTGTEGDRPPDPRMELKAQSVSELETSLAVMQPSVWTSDRRLRKDHFEAVLLEIDRRDGRQAELVLEQLLRRRSSGLAVAEQLHGITNREKVFNAWQHERQIVDYLQTNVEFLTALRRAQGRPDPLRVEVVLAVDADALPPLLSHSALLEAVESGVAAKRATEVRVKVSVAEKELDQATQWLETINGTMQPDARKKQQDAVARLQDSVLALHWDVVRLTDVEQLAPRSTKIDALTSVTAGASQLPILVVALKSADVEERPLWLRDGGDNFGVLGRWRVEVKDVTGKIQPARRRPMTGGGFSTERWVEHGTTWHKELALSGYVESLPPGEYAVSVLFHSEMNIAFIEEADLENLIVFRSQPFKLIVEDDDGNR